MLNFLRRNKNSKEENDTIIDEAFGEIGFFCDWFTVATHSFKLWNKIFVIRARAVANNRYDRITEEQRRAYLEYINSLEEKQSVVERMLSELFSDFDIQHLSDLITVQGVYFSKDGKYGIALKTDMDSDYIENHGIGPDDEFGICLKPQELIIPSNEEFLEYFK